ncbi:MAG TPA: hypothetical protein VN200_02790 [Rhodoglobus sp.]|nr:hypothetical protein [Rhodoglobus sp.]
MRGAAAAIGMAALLALYLVFTAQVAVRLILDDEPAAKGLGIALAVLPLLGAFTLVAELLFVFRGQRLLKRLGAEGGLPVDDLPRLPSGRIDPVAADERFPAFKAEVEAAPEDWRAWLRLGLAYDASGDRRRARWATRRAIMLERSARRGQR